MSRRNVGMLPVRGPLGILAGVVTDRDIALRCAAAGRDARIVAVEEIMTTRVVTAQPDMRVIAGKLSQLPPVTVYEPDYVKPLAEAGSAEDLQIEQHGDVWIVSGPWAMTR